MQPDDPTQPDDVTKTLDGYTFGELIGRGGIGEVVAAHDLRIGRNVAIKRLRKADPTPEETQRFLREARIQARLDHPAIPPVHEMGRDHNGRPYFTMKQLAGVTLMELLQVPEQNRTRLLRAFVEVCQAIEFAHARGVVHRDLKPGNVMVGNYGDIYVLDWGLARVVGEAITEVVTNDIDSLDVKSGDLLGTPGYMSPEQIQGVGDTGRPADVYALGSILFEILAGEPLHPRGSTAVASTLNGEVTLSPARRRADRAVPPELDSLCSSMLAMDPTTRPTARRVAERVQAFLDGDRDVARRRTMAVDLVWAARAAMNEERRAEAMRAAGRALALDPESEGAAELITALMLEPPTNPPPEVDEALRAADAENVSRHARTSVAAYLMIASFLPIAAWNGVRRWDVLLSVFAAALVLAMLALRIVFKPRQSFGMMLLYAIGNTLLLGLITRLAGPWTFVPALTCVVIMSMMAYPVFVERAWLLIAIMCVGFLVPITLEILGLLHVTWEIREGLLISHAGALDVNNVSTLTMLMVASLATIAMAGIHAAATYRAGRQAQRQLVVQAWHLSQLLPAHRGSGEIQRTPMPSL